MTAPTYLDVWSAQTFDQELRTVLEAKTSLIRTYFTTDRRLHLERETSDHRRPPASNPYSSSFLAFVEGLIPLLETRALRAWHYTRLTDAEVHRLATYGIELSTLASLRTRLDRLVAVGELTAEAADAIWTASPFHDSSQQSRRDKFWAVSTPQPVNNGGVVDLLRYWGGEVAYAWQKNQNLTSLLEQIGRSRVLEVVIPVAHTCHAYSAAKAVVSTFACAIGVQGDLDDFDLYTMHSLDPGALLKVHTSGDASFAMLGDLAP